MSTDPPSGQFNIEDIRRAMEGLKNQHYKEQILLGKEPEYIPSVLDQDD